MARVRKFMGRFEGEGLLTDPLNPDVRITVHYRYERWQEYTAKSVPTFTKIDGVVECTDNLALRKLWQEGRTLQLQTKDQTFNIYFTDATGEFIVTG